MPTDLTHHPRPLRAVLELLGRGRQTATAMTLTGDEWLAVVELADKHRVSTLLFHRLRTANRLSDLPAAAREGLRAAAFRSAAKNLRLRNVLRMVNRCFTAADIPFLALKGTHLAHGFYESPEQREMIDVDVIVPRESIRTAAAALEGSGFTPLKPYDLDTHLQHHHHLTPMLHNGVAVEVHWDLLPRIGGVGPPSPSLFEKATTFAADGVTMRGLSVDDLLVHLSVHAAQHHAFELGLRVLLDVDHVVARHPDLDWSRVRARAIEWSAWRPVLLLAVLAHDLLGTPLPALLLESIERDCDSEIRRLAARRLLSPRPRVSDAVARYAAAPTEWSTLRSGVMQLLSRRKIGWTHGLARTSPRVLLLYPVRAFDIARRHGTKAITWALGNPAEKREAREQLMLSEWLGGPAEDDA